MSVPVETIFDGFRKALVDLQTDLEKAFKGSTTVTICLMTPNSTTISATITGPHGSCYDGVIVFFDPHAYICSGNTNYTVYLTCEGIIRMINSTELKYPKQVSSQAEIISEIRLVEANKNRKSRTGASF